MRHAAMITTPGEPKPDGLQIDRIDQVGWIDFEAFSADVPFTAVRRAPSASKLGGSCEDPDGDAEFFA